MDLGAMRKAALNIRQGNTVSIVVRGRESRPHGEGGSLSISIEKGTVCETP